MKAPYDRILTLDFETRWGSKEYTLSKMTTEEYIRDPRFKAFGVCIHELGTDTPTQWHSHYDLPDIFATYDWTTTAVLCHNSQFDAAILSFIYDIRPCFVFDSLSMGRALRGVEVGNSLAKLAEDFGLPPKGRAVHSTDGLEELTPEIEHELAEYCKHDVFLCEEIFKRLVAGFPMNEMRLIDMTIRMYTEPDLVLDREMLQEALVEDVGKLQAALAKAGVEEAELASNPQFAEVLKRVGIVPPTKISKTTGKEAYAFAKNDALFQAILNGDNEDAVILCEARLKVKSTLERTRTQRFIGIAERGGLPVPLAYYGAATGRWSAAKGGSINLQNLKRGSALRKAIMAPNGYVICAGDLSQIEPRVLAWLADYEDMLDIFRAGGDPYATFGAQMFSIPGLSKETHPVLRQSSKSALLGAGYQLGWASFAAQLLVGFLGAPPVRYAKADAKQLGVRADDVQKFLGWEDNVRRMSEIPHTCSADELLIHCLAAKAIIDKYRAAAAPVVGFWDLLGTMLQECLYIGKEYTHKGILHFRKGEIEMANGMKLLYPGIEVELDAKGRNQYTFQDGKKRKKLYPGLLCNNVTQGTARIVMSDGLLRVQRKFPVKGTVHDEGLFLLREEEAEAGAAWVKAQMVQVPKWMPGIPLNADVGFDKRYGLAKG
jgi:DNA polymerase